MKNKRPRAGPVVITGTLLAAITLINGCFLFGGGGGGPVKNVGDVERSAAKYQAGERDRIDDLIEGFHNPDNTMEVRLAAAQALARTGDPEANLELIKGLEELAEPNMDLYLAVVRSLGTIGDPNATAALTRSLARTRKHFSDVRNVLLNSIGRTSDVDVIDVLLEALQASKEDYYLTQKMVSETLGGIGDQKAVPALMSIARDTDNEIAVRSHAVDILGRKKDPNLVPFLLEMFNDPRSQAQIRDFALKAADEVGDEKLILMLLEAFQRGRQRYQGLMNALSVALGETGDVRVAPTLVRIAQDKELAVLIRRTAVQNLGRINNPNVVVDLIELMRDPDNYIIYDDVYQTVNQLGGAEGLKALRAAGAAAEAAVKKKEAR